MRKGLKGALLQTFNELNQGLLQLALSDEFSRALSALGKERYGLAAATVDAAFAKVVGGIVIRQGVDELVQYVEGEKSLTVEELTGTCGHMVHEFRARGYALESIQGFAGKLLAGVQKHGDELYTTFPHGLDRELFDSGDEWNNAVKTLMSNLSSAGRLSHVVAFWKAPLREGQVVFATKGLKGTGEGVRLGGCLVYSPNDRRLSKVQDPARNPELFNKPAEKCPDNIAVPVQFRDPFGAVEHAKTRALAVLDFVDMTVGAPEFLDLVPEHSDFDRSSIQAPATASGRLGPGSSEPFRAPARSGRALRAVRPSNVRSVPRCRSSAACPLRRGAVG